MGDGRGQRARAVFGLGQRDVPAKPVDVGHDRRAVDDEPFARDEVRIDVVDADDVADRAPNRAARGAQILHREWARGVRPERVGEFGSRGRAVRPQQEKLDDLLIASARPHDRRAPDGGAEPSEERHVHHGAVGARRLGRRIQLLDPRQQRAGIGGVECQRGLIAHRRPATRAERADIEDVAPLRADDHVHAGGHIREQPFERLQHRAVRQVGVVEHDLRRPRPRRFDGVGDGGAQFVRRETVVEREPEVGPAGGVRGQRGRLTESGRRDQKANRQIGVFAQPRQQVGANR